MNTNLLLAFGCIKQAAEYITKAEKELYLDDAIRENDDAIMAIQNAKDKIESAYVGIVDDIDCEYHGINHKPKVEMITSYIGVVK